ncbi:aldo/keto reductase [Nocardiopsis sp. SBT366]|uniref:aldo/keto reductase n=1 Tax=Nocardiopsis sp. SBT366 TaxID=1580529 RepID=UPI00066BC729|nr:aldo/keto reductase [Nocardiopsis sp. SBT366]
MNTHITLNNGVRMPVLGMGTYAAGEATAGAVRTALQGGYRLVDTAAAYFNERGVGEGIRASGVSREDVFLTTKLWMTDHGYDSALRAFDTSLAKLGTDYLDLWLIHWPYPARAERTLDAYRAAERLLAEGRVRAIGVSNHTAQTLDGFVERTGIVPAVNQVELHPFFQQRDLQALNTRHGIITQSWSPLCGFNANSPEPDPELDPLANDVIGAIAARHGRSAAQVVLRWHLQQGRVVIPKSIDPAHIAQNIDVFGFELDADDLAAIAELDTGRRGGPEPVDVTPLVIDLTIDEA